MRKEWLERDYYATLGVDKDATAKEIKKAYRKLAQQYHPDTNSGDANAEAKFKEVNEAYDVLGDESTRSEYDQARDMRYFVGGSGGPGQQYVRIEDLFDRSGGSSPFDMFGGLGDFFGGRTAQQQPRPRQGGDIQTDLSLTFHEAISGVTRELSVDGRKIKVKIPKAVDDGAKVRLRGKGQPGGNGGPAGDLYVRVHVGEHPVFTRSGTDISIDVPISFTEATLGADIDVPTLDGKVTVRIPPGTEPGQVFKAKGKGVEDGKGRRGDLLVKVHVAIPTELNDDERKLIEALRDASGDHNPRAHLGV